MEPRLFFEKKKKGCCQKIKIPKLFEEVKTKPIPVPDPAPFSLSELSKLYTNSKAQEAQASAVETHRFGLQDLLPVAGPGGFNEELVSAKAAEWKALGLDWQGALAALEKTKAKVSYEELE